MTVQEYEAKFSEDDAPGWDTIAHALEKIYNPANASATTSRGCMRVWAARIT